MTGWSKLNPVLDHDVPELEGGQDILKAIHTFFLLVKYFFI
jgi:hypothetical protein